MKRMIVGFVFLVLFTSALFGGWSSDRDVYCSRVESGWPWWRWDQVFASKNLWINTLKQSELVQRSLEEWSDTLTGHSDVRFHAVDTLESNATASRDPDAWSHGGLSRHFVGLVSRDRDGDWNTRQVAGALIEYDEDYPLVVRRSNSVLLMSENEADVVVMIRTTPKRIRVFLPRTDGRPMKIFVYDREDGSVYQWTTEGRAGSVTSSHVIAVRDSRIEDDDRVARLHKYCLPARIVGYDDLNVTD